ncbi:ATP-binding protein [Pseudomonadota bacterium]
MMSPAYFFQRSIKYKIIAFMIVIVTVIVGGGKLYEYRLERNALEVELAQLSMEKIARLTENLILPLWEVDESWIEKVVLTEMLDPRAYAIVVKGEGGLLVRKGRNQHWQIIDIDKGATRDLLVFERDVMRAGEKIGSVELRISTRFMAAELRQRVLRELAFTTIMIVLLSVALAIMSNHVIIAPLRRLLDVSKAIADGDYSHTIVATSHDEVGVLGNGYNVMKENIQQRERELNNALGALEGKSKELRDANAQLEQDIADLLKAEASLRRWKSIFLNAGWGVVAGLDTFELMNPEFARMHGYEVDELLGQPVSVVFSPRARKMLPDIIKRVHSEGQVTFQSEHVRKDGSTFPVEMNITAVKDNNGEVLYRAVNVLDTTERNRLQAMMVQNEKMLSVGGLAAGMAHEINNPLSGVLQGVQNVQRRLSKDIEANHKVADEIGIDFDKLQEYLQRRRVLDFFDAISDSGKRASAIVVNMLGFSRKGGDTMEPVDVEGLVDQVLTLAAMDYDLKKQYDFKNITLKRDLPPGVPDVPCVRSEIQQVLLNLLTNAAHAFQAGGVKPENPELTVRVAQDGDMVLIEVADNGPGMTDAVAARVFEPFFTTKPPGKGTGLGLSVAYYIINDEHHGRMEVETAPGHGATFKIWLPLKQEQE